MPVPAAQAGGAWPLVTPGGEESDEEHRMCCTAGTGAWAPGGWDQRVRGAYKNAEGRE